MGDTEQIDDPKAMPPDDPVSSSHNREAEPSTPAFEEVESPPGSTPLSEDRPQVRRSSLRPAPPSFRPSARSPGQFRPAMVIHAGDAEPSAPKWDVPDPPPSHPSQIQLDSVARVEPFALAEDLTPNTTDDPTLPLVIPPPAAIPCEALSRETLQAPKEHRRAERAIAEAAPAAAHPASSPTDPSTPTRRTMVAVAIAFALVGAIAMTMLGQRHNSSSGELPNIEPSAKRADQVPAQASALVPREPPTLPQVPAANPGMAVEAPAGPAPATSAAPPMLPPNTTRVTLELTPLDAKVNLRGVAVPGPPYVFDVPNGKHIAVEASRSGFVTRKIVIEDKKPVVSIGLMRAAHPRQQR
jgi:hypothetical protein